MAALQATPLRTPRSTLPFLFELRTCLQVALLASAIATDHGHGYDDNAEEVAARKAVNALFDEVGEALCDYACANHDEEKQRANFMVRNGFFDECTGSTVMVALLRSLGGECAEPEREQMPDTLPGVASWIHAHKTLNDFWVEKYNLVVAEGYDSKILKVLDKLGLAICSCQVTTAREIALKFEYIVKELGIFRIDQDFGEELLIHVARSGLREVA